MERQDLEELEKRDEAGKVAFPASRTLTISASHAFPISLSRLVLDTLLQDLQEILSHKASRPLRGKVHSDNLGLVTVSRSLV